MDAQLFIRTWENDLQWLKVCFKSVAVYWKSALRPKVVATPECFVEGKFSLTIDADLFSIGKFDDQRRGSVYLGFTADRFCDAELILYTDSDCMFIRTCKADDFFQDGKIVLYGEPYGPLMEKCNAPDHNCFTWYRRVANEVLGIDSPAEYMCRHPFMFYRKTLRRFRTFVEERLKIPLPEVMMKYHSGYFSEFNLLSAYALVHEPDLYTYAPVSYAPDPFIRQFHSWSQDPTSLDIGLEIRKILKP